mmetsp:Transcript_16872/g.24719  ORF Transcript_16872/g.24719 Transcript_16872/m.24719 type:complete len:224 (-) Transcript_16872:322-993(-)
MIAKRVLLLVITGVVLAASDALFHSTEKSDVEVIGNPHAKTDESSPDESTCSFSSSCQPHLLLSPHRVIHFHMPTQSDTLIEVTTEKILSVPVPIYHFHQPARISNQQLPFKIVLVSDLDGSNKEGLHEIPVDPVIAADSWFPGYSWTPIVCVNNCQNPVHVGWKFQSPEEEFFYALIVQTKDERESEAVGIGALGEAIAKTFTVGTLAPEWMVDSLGKIMSY